MTYYKVLLQGRSCHGGDAEWALPKQREDGTWEPGDWMPEIQGPLMLNISGYHLTSDPARWWQEGADCYVAEWDGEHVGDGGDKIAVRRCRLLRRLTAAELASLRVFTEGSHQVSDGVAWASGSARVEVSGSARVDASGSARVEVSDSAQVWASGSARVNASGSAWVWVYDYAQVKARDSAWVWAFDSARVEASGSARVEVSDSVRAWAFDSAQVEARGSAQVEVYDSAQVWARGSVQVWAHDSARIRAHDSVQVEVYDSTQVEVYDSAQIKAHDSARVRAHDSAQVWADDSAQVEASGSAQVEASGFAQVWAHGSALVRTPPRAWGQPTVITSGAAVWVDYRSGGVPVVHTAEGKLEPGPRLPADPDAGGADVQRTVPNEKGR